MSTLSKAPEKEWRFFNATHGAGPNGTTTFSGRRTQSINFIDRTGARFGTVELTTPGYSGNWFGRCHSCGHEALYTKNEIRRAVFKCRGCGR